MIMITNKKTEKQMTEDLELFLGGLEQAQNFSTWLHTLIKKTIGKKISQGIFGFIFFLNILNIKRFGK
jgi:hypothetical protein